MTDESQKQRPPRILLGLLDFEMRSRLGTVLRGAGYEVVTCVQSEDLPTLSAAADTLRSYDLAIWDVKMLDVDAATRIVDLQTRAEFPPLILVTAFSDPIALERIADLKREAEFYSPLDSYHQLARVMRIVPL